MVYLVKPADGAPDEAALDALLTAPPELDMPASVAATDTETWRQGRKDFGPVFAGTLTPELTFFTFDVTPGDLDLYWLVLDEPPAELRFKNNKTPRTTDAAAFAESTLDEPTRVAIDGDELEHQGLNS